MSMRDYGQEQELRRSRPEHRGLGMLLGLLSLQRFLRRISVIPIPRRCRIKNTRWFVYIMKVSLQSLFVVTMPDFRIFSIAISLDSAIFIADDVQ